MAWPCISRVCCLARFWNQFDKSDLSVPLTIQNYSDIGEQEVRSVTRHVPTELRGSPRQQGPSAPRGSSRGRREPLSYKPREDYQPPDVPFPSTTQYKQDFKPWPIPRKETFPWISNGGSGADGVSDPPVNVHPQQQQQQQHHAGQPQGEWAEREERGAGTTRTSSYRQEYRPWTGAKPAKSTRRNPPAPYISTETEASQTPPETSYQAAYSGEAHRSLGLHQADHCPAAPSTIAQPASVPQPKPTPLQSGCTTAAGPPGILQGHPPERNNVTTVKGEEHLVRTKLPPNPSAIFQSGSRVFSI